MAQSDYLIRKRTHTQLQYPTKMAPILSSQEYIAYKKYVMETNGLVTLAKLDTYNRLTTPGKYKIGDIDTTMDTCPTFILCNNTNTRPNRQIRPEGLVCIPLNTHLPPDSIQCRLVQSDDTNEPSRHRFRRYCGLSG